jgi:3-oxoacyl-[acyl-carrier protein] reductase
MTHMKSGPPVALVTGASRAVGIGAAIALELAAAHAFQDLGITANVINPGATDTAWMSEELREQVRRKTLSGRIGLPQDCARLVKFLCSPEGRRINGQLLYSSGGLC